MLGNLYQEFFLRGKIKKQLLTGTLIRGGSGGGSEGGGSGAAEGKFGKIYALVERSLNPPIEAGKITIVEGE